MLRQRERLGTSKGLHISQLLSLGALNRERKLTLQFQFRFPNNYVSREDPAEELFSEPEKD